MRPCYFCHFFTLPLVWGRAHEPISKLVNYWFELVHENRQIIDVIIGEYPACHSRIENFISKLGGVYIGEIPAITHGGKRVGSKIVYITREGFNGRQR